MNYYSEGNLLSNGSSFADGSSDEYSTAYTEDLEETGYKTGEATYEASEWHNNYAGFVSSNSPFFLRGGSKYNGGSAAGVFYFYRKKMVTTTEKVHSVCVLR